MSNPSTKVIFFLSDLDGGGAQRTMLNIANNIGQFGIEPVIALGRSDGPLRQMVAEGVQVVDFDCGRVRHAVGPLRRLLAAQQPQVLFSTMVASNIVATLAVLGLSHAPSLVLRETNSHAARGDLSWLMRKAIKFSYRRAAAVVALSSGVGQELIEEYGLPEERVPTIYNPVETTTLSRRVSAVEAAPKSKKRLLLAIGRLSRQKGFDRLLRCFAAANLEDWELVVLGEGADRKDLEAYASSLGISAKVRFPGYMSDIAPWLKAADMFVLSSRWEGFGHVIVEAMTCGVPVVSFDCPYGPRDIIEHDVSGWLVPNDDEPGLTQALNHLAKEPVYRQRLAAEGLVAAQKFRAEIIAGQYADLFNRFVSKPI